jgi:ABC-2 type transport system permease protein
MLHDLHYFIIQTRYNIKNAYALSGSFWIGIVSMMVNNATFFIIWLLFMHATGPINGWTGLDVFGMLGVAMAAFGCTHGLFYGVVELPQSVIKGTFDSVLLSPVNIFTKLAGSGFSITAYGDLIQGSVIVLLYGILSHFTFFTWGMYLVSIFFGCIIFLSIQTLCSLVVFFIHDGDVVARQLFEIFLRPGLYPGAIFPSKMKLFFMTVIPTLLTSAVPIDVVKMHSLWLLVFGAVMTLVWVLITYIVFTLAVRRYESGNYLR